MDQSPAKKILIVLPNWIGDAVMSIPAIFHIRAQYPSARITVIGLPHITELFKESPFVDEIRAYLKKSPFSKGGLKGICQICKPAGVVAAGFSLRSGNYDLALLLPNSFSSALLVRLANIPNRCGYNRDARGFLLTMPVRLTPEIKKLHQSEYYLHLANSISPFNHPLFQVSGTEFNSVPKIQGKMGASLFLSKEEIHQARELLAKNHITPGDLLIGINPGAAYGSSKRWHPERFGQVASALIRKYHAKVILFGGPGEREIAEEIVRASGMMKKPSPSSEGEDGYGLGESLLNMTGQTTIRGLMALLSQCRLLITNDSGPMHIAAALGVPVVAIFGSTDPAMTAPTGSGHIVIRKDVPCSPCFRRECPTDMECMDLIQVEDVLDGVEKILGQRIM